MNLNKVYIIGRLTRDVELRSTPSGQTVASFGVATNRVWNSQTGQKQEEVEYHNVVVWGRQAELANQYLGKGRLVMIEGRLRTRNWDSKGGEKHYRTEIVAERMQFGPRGQGQEKLDVPAPREEEKLDEIKLDDEAGFIPSSEGEPVSTQESLKDDNPF